MTAELPRPVKRLSGRTAATRTPANIRTAGVSLDEDDRVHIRRKLGMRLGKFAHAIERVSVRVQDVNGPKGGVDQLCRIKVVLSSLPSVVVQERDHSTRASIDRAIGRTERAVREMLARTRARRAELRPRI